MFLTLIRGGHLIDPESGIDALHDVLIQDGLVSAIEKPGQLNPQACDELVDASGCIVAPGLVDMHVHLREPGQTWKETIATGTAAGAAGGFTTLVAMPNTLPVNDSVSTMAWMLDLAREPQTRLFAMPAVSLGSNGRQLTDFKALAEAGAVGFTDDGKPVLDEALMREALRLAGQHRLIISQHAEDTRISPSSGVNAGPLAFRLGLRGMSVEAESSIVERDIRLLREVTALKDGRPHLHVQHVSTARALQVIRAAKAEGLAVSCEATPHHFVLTEEAISDFDTNAKMNPPLRTETDRQAVIAALLDGTIDCIATDHAPHALFEKEVEFERAPNGLTGLETALGLAIRVLHRERGASLTRIVELMASRPARLIGKADAASLRIGSWGDVIIFNAGEEWNFHAAESRSRSRNTPFDGAPMLGRVQATLVAGRVVYRNSTA